MMEIKDLKVKSKDIFPLQDIFVSGEATELYTVFLKKVIVGGFDYYNYLNESAKRIIERAVFEKLVGNPLISEDCSELRITDNGEVVYYNNDEDWIQNFGKINSEKLYRALEKFYGEESE